MNIVTGGCDTGSHCHPLAAGDSVKQDSERLRLLGSADEPFAFALDLHDRKSVDKYLHLVAGHRDSRDIDEGV